MRISTGGVLHEKVCRCASKNFRQFYSNLIGMNPYVRHIVPAQTLGEPSAVGSTLVMTQYINENALEEIVSDGAVGDVCLRFYDKDGNMEPFNP